jgi:hypothetical protein
MVWFLVGVPGAAVGGGGIILLIVVLLIGFILKTAFQFVSAFWVIFLFIAAIVFALIITLAFVKSGVGKFFAFLVTVGLIVGLIVVKWTLPH